ncbi:HicB family protein [Clostridium botulinum]|uniref:type II toxin-antitoxin system HicB family antitoxin n=1 Tax=Clostridium botulinum TaxID=1491 RepID=UPI00016B965E|nr:type II toxin-antitoxin system HicB family antitoxin [Clostridium botulinum]EDT87288.1 heat shock protein, molecular chaperone [Clostridium botulinum Bf]MBN3409925.1 HicB family protein [Clostridium botulinum]MBY6797062.1 type II toxin-antitoxin system HicB family antitoxin [Clostridium botulinum]MBY6866515.1 type II toxin-antitoxin system HicB family antitoxin [Clostridium botulinum]MBY6873014.1 type II toxin-antitoxin system HicB family antitoxin [Clostridium botulinum]
MYKENYIFPAIITKLAETDYNVSFPDFDEIITYGESVEEAYIMAEDALSLELFDLWEDKKEISEPTNVDNLTLENNETLILVKLNLKDVLKKYDNKAVKKTLTIPSWLNKVAEENKVNFSQILQAGLMEYLNINEKR